MTRPGAAWQDDTPNTDETRTGATGTCTGVAGADNRVHSKGHSYAGQGSTDLSVCGYGPSVCPPNGSADCGFADTALRRTEVKQDAYWGRDGDTFVIRISLR